MILEKLSQMILLASFLMAAETCRKFCMQEHRGEQCSIWFTSFAPPCSGPYRAPTPPERAVKTSTPL